MSAKHIVFLCFGAAALFGIGYCTRVAQDRLPHTALLVPEQRLKDLQGTTCPAPSLNTKPLLEAIERVVLRWPSSEEVVNGLQLPINYSDPRWCFLPFARGSDLYIVADAVVREASLDRVRVDVYSAIDTGLLQSDRPSFSLIALNSDGVTYVFDSRLYHLSALRSLDAEVKLQ